MKTNTRINSVLLVLALLLSVCSNARAQFQGIDLLSGYCPNTTIIREWKDGYALIYSKELNSQEKWFHLVKSGSSTFNSFKVGAVVRDIEILGDTAYFCGNDDTGDPVIGYFDLPTFLASTPQLAMVSIGATLYHPKRMEVFPVADGLHIVMVGDYTTGIGETDRFLADVSHYYPTDDWSLFYHSDVSQAEYFDDIAVTDKYVVTAGHKHQGRAVYMRMFTKPVTAYPIYQSTSFYNNSIFWDPSNIQNQIYCSVCDFDLIRDDETDYPVWITHTTGDSVAIAYLSEDRSSGDYGITLRIFEIVPPPNNWFIYNNLFLRKNATLDPGWRVLDVRYSSRTDEILMLRENQGASRLTTFSNANPTIALDCDNQYGIHIHSIDHFNPLKGVMMSGESHNMYWLKTDMRLENCYLYKSPKVTKSDCIMEPFYMPICDNYAMPSFTIRDRSIQTKSLINVCN